MKFPCQHCGGHIEVGEELYGFDINCPHCSRLLRVPDEPAEVISAAVKPSSIMSTTSKKNEAQSASLQSLLTNLPNRNAMMAGIVMISTVILAGLFLSRNSEAGEKSKELNRIEERYKEVFGSSRSKKDDVMGLKGGMSKAEAIATLGLRDLTPARLEFGHGQLWIAEFPGFSAFDYYPGANFPIEEVHKIRLVFLEDRLQSVLYLFKQRSAPAVLKVYSEGGYRIEASEPSRESAINELREALAEDFDPLSRSLGWDYTTGKNLYTGDAYIYDEISNDNYYEILGNHAIFQMTSSGIFVQLLSELRGLRANKYDGKAYVQLFSGETFERNLDERFVLQFSFANTALESVIVAHDTIAREKAQLAANREKRQEETERRKAEEERRKLERAERLREGF